MKKVMVLIFLCVGVASVYGQSVEYSYDAAGNRIGRIAIFFMPPDGDNARQADDSETELDERKQADLSGIRVFPNPTDDHIQVTMEQVPPQASIMLYDLSGRELLRQPLADARHSISMATYAAGDYILVIEGTDFRGQWKVIKL